MIISASRRTDIPALYSTWFMKRLEEGYVMVPYPRNTKRVGRVKLMPDLVDCIVFWTKNAAPILGKLSRIRAMGYPFFFHFTLTPYERVIERNLPPKKQVIETLKELARCIGASRVVWRYDPVLVDSTHTVDWHLEKFRQLCKSLQHSTRHCVLSFFDPYPHLRNAFRALNHTEITGILSGFSEIAGRHDIALFACAEELDAAHHLIKRSSCIDRQLIEEIAGYRVTAKKDSNQRPACNCLESVDIGVYNTCSNGCSYCYANSATTLALRHFHAHDPSAPMITGYPAETQVIIDRTTASHKNGQWRLL